MPLTIKTTRLKYKDSNGDYVGVDAVAEQTTSEAVSDITSAKNTAITAIENKQSAAETAVQNKGTTTLASIPQDYTTLSGEVTDLKENLKYISNVVYESTQLEDVVFTQGQVLTTGVFDGSISTWCGTSNFYKAEKGSIITVDSHDNYRFIVAYYTSPSIDDFVNYKGASVLEPFVMPIDGYVRFSIRKNPAEDLSGSTAISSHFVTDLHIYLKDIILDMNTKSPYLRNVFYGVCNLQGYIEANGSFDLFDVDTTASDFYSAFTNLVQTYAINASVNDLGVCSDGVNHLYSYDIKPLTFTTTPIVNNIPKIIIISGQHGFEKAAPYGLYYFVKELLTNWKNNSILNYIRNHIELLIVPCVNPYGFNNFVYGNANGVNLNNNYDCNFVEQDPSSTTYGGAYPFSEPETIIIRNLINANTDAIGAFDFHTNGSSNVSRYSDMNWYSFTVGSITYNDPCFQKLYGSAGYNITEITAHFIDEFNMDTNGAMCGKITVGDALKPTFKDWAIDKKNLLSCTVEGFCGFYDEVGDYTPDVSKANCEIIMNFISTFVAKIRELGESYEFE